MDGGLRRPYLWPIPRTVAAQKPTMVSATVRPRPRRFRAPPPTPIATGKGSRSAAVDERFLADYLDASLRVPELALPVSHFPAAARQAKLRPPPEFDLPSLVLGDAAAARRVAAAAVEVGSFRVAAVEGGRGGVAAEEVRAVITAGANAFGVAEERRKELGGRWFGQREGVGGQEFYWPRPVGPEEEKELKAAMPGQYHALREALENISVKLEMVADTISQILLEYVKDQRRSTRNGKMQSTLCLRKHDSYPFRRNWSGGGNSKSPALSLHLCGDDREFCLCSPEGSVFFGMPAGSILVTIGKQFEEWSNGEIKSATGEIQFEPNEDRNLSFSLEFMCSPAELCPQLESDKKTVPILDQLLIVLVLAFLYGLWTCVSPKFT